MPIKKLTESGLVQQFAYEQEQPWARKVRAPSGRKPARFDTNDMYGELPPWMTR